MTEVFPATRAPDGLKQALAALATLARRVPALARVDIGRLYEVTRPYFTAGWCVRDVLTALDTDPAGRPYFGHEVAWTSSDDPDQMLHRVRQCLRAWRLADGDGDDAVMTGGYTAMARAMAAHAEAQYGRALARALDHDRRQRSAAGDCPGRTAAHRAARRAASVGRRARSTGDERERARVRALLPVLEGGGGGGHEAHDSDA